MVKGFIDTIKEPYGILSREYHLATEARKKYEKEKKKEKVKEQYYYQI